MVNQTTISINEKKPAPPDVHIEKETFFRYFHLPYIIMDLFFDYVETVTNQAAILKISAVKNISRTIKSAHKDYEYLKSRHLSFKYRQREMENMEFFIELYSKEMNAEFDLLKWKITQSDKSLLPDQVIFIASVYMGICVYQALIEYAKKADMEIEKLWGKCNHSIIPDVIPYTYSHLVKYLGGNNIIGQDDLQSSWKRVLMMIQELGFREV